MGIFNNVGNIATNLGSNLLGGAINKVTNNIAANEEEESWMNRNGWFFLY